MRKGEKMSEEQKRLRSERMRGAGNHQWRGGRRVMPNGYVATGKRGLEHRVVLEAVVGRALGSLEQVHHVNEARDDNRLENLWLFPNDAAHSHWHWMERHGEEIAEPMSTVALAWA